MSRSLVFILILTLALATGCSRRVEQELKFSSRQDFHAFVDTLEIPEEWKDTIKLETNRVSGKFINNAAKYLDLRKDDREDDELIALIKRYGPYAEVTYDGVDIQPAVKQAVDDLIREGNKKNPLAPNSKWLVHEQVLDNDKWSEGQSLGRQMGELYRQRLREESLDFKGLDQR